MSEAFAEFQQLLKQKRYKDAAGLAEKECQKNSSPDPFWLTQQAVALVRAGEPERALAAANQALAVDPSNPYAIMVAADSLLELGKSGGVTRALPRGVRLCQACPPGSKRGARMPVAALPMGRDEFALLAEWALPEEESAPWKVKALAGLGRREEAIAECTRWLERVPDHPPALWALTEMEVERDGLAPVIERMERALRIPSLPPVYREIYASLCRKAGRPEAALREYEKLEAQGAGPRVQKRQAFLLAKSGKESEALPLLEELLRAEPADMYLHSSYEAACKRMDDTERAINFYTTLLVLHPEAKSLYGRIRTLRRRLENPS